MHILLQQIAPGLPAPRFVRLALREDLFGGWELIRESGQLGGKSQVRRELFLSQAEAREALETACAALARRGFVAQTPQLAAA